MHSSNANNILMFSRHFKSEPNTPTKADNIESFMSLLLQVFAYPIESLLHNFEILIFNRSQDRNHIGLSIVWFG